MVIQTSQESASVHSKQDVTELVEIAYTHWNMMILIGGMTMIIITMFIIHKTEDLEYGYQYDIGASYARYEDVEGFSEREILRNC